MTQTVLILGPSGKIGTHAARAFDAAGWQVRRYRRGTDMTAAAMGADVIVNGLNPPNYHNWAEEIPRITSQVIAAATASGATVILPGNVYVFGEDGGVWDETTPHRPTTRKGRIRAEMERAYRDSGVPVILLRAGNFIDPDRNGDVVSLVMLKGIARGRLTTLGPLDAEQAYAWLPDWAEAARMLAERRESLARFEDVPFPGHTLTTGQMADQIARLTGTRPRIGRFPWWALRLLSPVWELAREMTEMRGLFATSHRLGGDRFARLLPEFRATPVDQVLAAMLPVEIHPDQPVRTGGKTVLSQ